MWFRKRKPRRDTRGDLAAAQESFEQARQARAGQQRKRRQEHEAVISRINRAQEHNNIAGIIRQALRHHGGPA